MGRDNWPEPPVPLRGRIVMLLVMAILAGCIVELAIGR